MISVQTVSKKRVIVYGVSGVVYSSIIDTLINEYDVFMLTDSNSGCWGRAKKKISIEPPEVAVSKEYDLIVIASSFVSDISKKLVSLGVPLEKIEVGYNFIFQNMLSASAVHVSVDRDFNLKMHSSTGDTGVHVIQHFKDTNIAFRKHDVKAIVEMMTGEGVRPFFEVCEKLNKYAKGVFVDVGANIGTTTLEASKNANVTQCISFEPSFDTFSILSANIHLNKLSHKVTAHHFAVGAEKCVVYLELSAECSGDNKVLLEGISSSNSEVVQSVTLDEFLSEDLENIRYLWVDVQGVEYFVLKGGEELLTRFNPAIQIEYWPEALAQNDSLNALNDFLIKNFTHYVDMDAYDGGIVHKEDMAKVRSLADKLMREGKFTNLFLI